MRSDAEWYFEQSRKSAMFYYVFFTLLKHYGIPYWSAATAAERHTVEEALDKAMRFLEAQQFDWAALSKEEKEHWMQEIPKKS